MDNQPNWIVLGIAVIAMIVMVIALFLPWADAEIALGGSNSLTIEYTLWERDVVGEDESWFGGDHDEDDGIGLIRAAVIVALIGTALLLGGIVLSALPPVSLYRFLGAGGLIVGGLAIAVGAILYLIGASDYNTVNFSKRAEFGIAIGGILAFVAATASLAAGAVAILMPSGPQIALVAEAPRKV